MRLYTIGSNKASAEQFFVTLKAAGVSEVVDIRLSQNSYLHGWTRGRDLIYFLKHLNNMGYRRAEYLAPTPDLLNTYRKDNDWDRYEAGFRALMKARTIERLYDPKELNNTAFLCFEATPEKCHRRLVAEHLASHWPAVEIEHLFPGVAPRLF